MVRVATITRTSDRERERLRRSAAGTDQGPTPEQQSHNHPSLEEFMHRIGDPNGAPPNFPELRAMRRDHMFSMGLHFIAMPIVQAPWYYESDDARAAAFADNLIRPIYGRLILTILRFLWSGYSPAVKNFELVNPNWTYLPGVMGEPKRVWDSPGGVEAMVYKPVTPLRPENALPVWRDGKFAGISYDGRYGGAGYFVINGEKKPDIDLLHSVWAVHDQDNEDGSPFGWPRIAHGVDIWRMYRYIWTLLARAFENNADPGPVVRYPTTDPPFVDASGKTMRPVDIALRVGRRRRSGSTLAIPSDPYLDFQDKPTNIKKWDIDYPESKTDFAAIQQFLDWLESLKLRALWLQEQGLIEGSGSTSNRNVAEEFGDKRDASQVVLMSQIDALIDEAFIKPAFAMNMPWFEGRLEKKTIGFGSGDEDIVRQILQLYGQALPGMFRVDVNRILEAKGLPMLGPEATAELNRQLKEAAQQAETQGPPATKPTQGRRAMVTQTGFNEETGQPEMSYVQTESPIVLSDDGDFVSSLPRTDVFADRQVVAVTRAMRTEAAGFLSWLYNDFARFVGKQKMLDLATELEAAEQELLVEGEEFDEDAKVRRVVDKLLNRWRPKAERIATFSEKSRNILGRAFDKTAGLQLGRVRSAKRISSFDRTAAAWLDDKGAEMVSGVLDTTRKQLAKVLADGVREGKRPTQIAADIREHFDTFPATRAAAIARTEISSAYNFATVQAGLAAGIKKAQLLDGNDDAPCKKRNGKIVNLIDALKEKLAHTNCTLTVRLLPQATTELSVREEALNGLRARFDAPTQTILFAPETSESERSQYLIRLGDRLAEPGPPEDEAEEAVAV